MAFSPKYTTLILDLGDVLFEWSRRSNTSITPVQLEEIISSKVYQEFECGLMTQQVCYERLARDFSIDETEIAFAIAQVRRSLRANFELSSAIRQLKAESRGSLAVYAMSNISTEDYAYLRTIPADWEVFDGVFISAAVGHRKPSPIFYEIVLRNTNTKPQNAIFVDDKVENVIAAQRLGIHGIVFSDALSIGRTLRSLVGDPVERGRTFLLRNARNFVSETNNEFGIKDNFSQLLILEATNNWDLASIDIPIKDTWNFFIGRPILTSTEYPDDLDTTALGALVIPMSAPSAHAIMDKMLQWVNEDGIIQVYYDRSRPRIDPVVATNVLTLFYAYDRGHELPLTLEYVLSTLQSRSYLTGLRYYASPESFLFFLCRLLKYSTDVELYTTLKPLLKEQIRERIGLDADVLALAMRVDVCAKLGILNDGDLEKLLSLQEDNGSWGVGWAYRFGRSGWLIGNRGVTTALAVNAVRQMRKLHSRIESVKRHQAEKEAKALAETAADDTEGWFGCCEVM